MNIVWVNFFDPRPVSSAHLFSHSKNLYNVSIDAGLFMLSTKTKNKCLIFHMTDTIKAS
jgi:hypothetical protein